MENRLAPQFETPGFGRRLKTMLGVDFYRLFHTPLFYIMLAISAIIPAMILAKMKIRPSVDGVFGLEEVSAALQKVAGGGSRGKTVIYPAEAGKTK